MVQSATPGTVMVGVDGSDGALEAVRWATQEAGIRKASLKIVAAAPRGLQIAYGPMPANYFQEMADNARADLANALDVAVSLAKHVDMDIKVSTELLSGEPVPELVAASRQAELFVVGRHGQHRSAIATVGSVTWGIAGSTYSPLAVVTDFPISKPSGVVAVGVDSSAYSRRALDLAFHEASLRGAELRVVHAWTWNDMDSVLDPLNTVPAGRPQAESIALSEMLAGYCEDYPEVVVRQRLVEERPYAALVVASATADLLVVGSRGRGRLSSVVLGSTSHRLLSAAACPLLIAR